MMMILSFVVTCLVSLRALRLRTLVIHSIIVIHSSPHCVDARFALASLALLTYAKVVSDMYWSVGINGTGLVCVAWTIPSPLVLCPRQRQFVVQTVSRYLCAARMALCSIARWHITL